MAKAETTWKKGALAFVGGFMAAFFFSTVWRREQRQDTSDQLIPLNAELNLDVNSLAGSDEKTPDFDWGPRLKNRTHDASFDHGQAYQAKMKNIDPHLDRGSYQDKSAKPRFSEDELQEV